MTTSVRHYSLDMILIGLALVEISNWIESLEFKIKENKLSSLVIG